MSMRWTGKRGAEIAMEKAKPVAIEPVHDLVKPGPPRNNGGTRYLCSKGAGEDLVKRVMLASAGEIIRVTAEEMRIWRDHVVVING